MVNAALIGFGWWGKNLAKAIENDQTKIRFSRIITKELNDAKEYCQAHQIQLSDDYQSALTDPSIEAVVLATPHSMHAEQIILAAKAGKHVFCEKPLTLKHEDAKSAIQACEEYRVILAVGQNKRFWPSMAKLREVICGGTFCKGHSFGIQIRNPVLLVHGAVPQSRRRWNPVGGAPQASRYLRHGIGKNTVNVTGAPAVRGWFVRNALPRTSRPCR